MRRRFRLGWAFAAVFAVVNGASGAPTGHPPTALVVGNDVFQPGAAYQTGPGWLGLLCDLSGCRLVPARLEVSPARPTGLYDDQPIAGQQLRFTLASKAPGRVLGWFHPDARLPWLVPGSVTTYVSAGDGVKRRSEGGTFDVTVPLPGGQMTIIAPLLDQQHGAIVLQLRTTTKRQLLRVLPTCSGEGLDRFLLWAGDIDRDGRPDYLLDFASQTGGEAVLYLSSAADASQPLVGPGAVFQGASSGAECDGGSAWLGN